MKMKTKLWAIILMVFVTLLTSIAQILYKLGVDKLEFDIISIITNYPIIMGIALYVIGAVLMIISFKGGEVSVLYPIIATSYIWVSLLSSFFFNEIINIIRWAGIFVIFIGITFVGLGSKKMVEVV